MRQYKNGAYSNYKPRYCYKILSDGTVAKGLWKQERTLKDFYNALFRVSSSLSVRLTALTSTSFIRFRFEPLKTTLEVTTAHVLSLQKVLDLSGESKFYIPITDKNIKLIEGPQNWAELLQKIKKPKIMT